MLSIKVTLVYDSYIVLIASLIHIVYIHFEPHSRLYQKAATMISELCIQWTTGWHGMHSGSYF